MNEGRVVVAEEASLRPISGASAEGGPNIVSRLMAFGSGRLPEPGRQGGVAWSSRPGQLVASTLRSTRFRPFAFAA